MTKLIDKLADQMYNTDCGNDKTSYENGFKAGFLKAREMAIELTRKPCWMLLRDIPNLGEEEV